MEMSNTSVALLTHGHALLTTDECVAKTEDVAMSYLRFIYCDFGNNFTALGLIIYLVWVITMFAMVATTVDHFFCPSLEVIAKTLRLSQSVAGVTFLAFGNGAPEIFSAIAGASVERPDLIISGLFGSGMFLTCVVAGCIILISPFKMVERPFLRDIIFYMMVSFWTFYLIYNQTIKIEHGFSFIALYLTYIIFVLAVHHIYQRYIKPRNNLSETLTLPASILRLNNTLMQQSPIPKSPDVSPEGGGLDSEVIIEFDEIAPWGAPPIVKHWDSGDFNVTTDLLDDFCHVMNQSEDSDIDGPLTSSVKSTKSAARNATRYETCVMYDSVNARLASVSTWKLFLYGICPVNYHRWHKTAWWKKVLQILRAPLVIVLKLTVPVVNFKDQHGCWCRPLNALHVVLSPLFVLFGLNYGTRYIFPGFQIWMLFLVLGLAFCMLTLLSTVNTVPPQCHCLFAFLGFITSVVWIYILATQIVEVLMTFGVVLKLSDNFLGLTILSWGNGLPDLIADVTIAKQGLPQMALSACFGGPLIILLLGFGIPFTVTASHKAEGIVKVVYSKSSTLFFTFTAASILSSLIVFPLCRFQVHKMYGYYLLSLYLIFVILVTLNEFELL